jgi:hypothetical protein
MNTQRIPLFIGGMVLAAVGLAGYASHTSHAFHGSYALAVLALAAATSRMKVRLPGINGNMSVNLPFLLLAVVNLSALEAVSIACTSTLVQCWPASPRKFKPERMIFNVSMMAFATSLANLAWHAGSAGESWASQPLLLTLATAAFFLGQTLPVAGIIKLAEGAAFHTVWLSILHLSFPYYVLSAGVTSMVLHAAHRFGWQAPLSVFLVMYGIYRSYRVCFGLAAQISGEAPRTVALAKAAGAGA